MGNNYTYIACGSYLSSEHVLRLMEQHLQEEHGFEVIRTANEADFLEEQVKEHTESHHDRECNIRQWEGMMRAEKRNAENAAKAKSRSSPQAADRGKATKEKARLREALTAWMRESGDTWPEVTRPDHHVELPEGPWQRLAEGR